MSVSQWPMEPKEIFIELSVFYSGEGDVSKCENVLENGRSISQEHRVITFP